MKVEAVKGLKPKMKPVKSLREIPLPCVATAKIDGEFQVVLYKDGEAVAINRWGRARSDLPALRELGEALKNRLVREAVFLAELYAVDGEGTPLPLPELLRRAKGGSRDLDSLRLAVFDLLEVNGSKVGGDFLFRISEAESWLKGCKLIRIIPYDSVESPTQLEAFYNTYREMGYEGIVAHTDIGIYKYKPVQTLDAVVIALNKTELWSRGQAASLKTALIDGEGHFIEICDVASGITHQLRAELMTLKEFKVAETSDALWMKPFIVITVECQAAIESQRPMYRYSEENGYQLIGSTQFYSLRHPRLKRFRPDKEASPRDTGINQLT